MAPTARRTPAAPALRTDRAPELNDAGELASETAPEVETESPGPARRTLASRGPGKTAHGHVDYDRCRRAFVRDRSPLRVSFVTPAKLPPHPPWIHRLRPPRSAERASREPGCPPHLHPRPRRCPAPTGAHRAHHPSSPPPPAPRLPRSERGVNRSKFSGD